MSPVAACSDTVSASSFRPFREEPEFVRHSANVSHTCLGSGRSPKGEADTLRHDSSDSQPPGWRRRSRARNAPTVLGIRSPAPRTERLRTLFLSAYGELDKSCRDYPDPGLAVVAVSEETGRLAGFSCLPARPGDPTAAVIGRHGCADVYLSGSATLALRHLAIIVEPVLRWAAGHIDVRYRVLDLRSENGFQDETGRSLRSLTCEGPAIISCSGFALYLLPLGDPTDFPERASDAWEMLPERVYFDEVTRFPEGTNAAPLWARPKRAHSRLMRTLPPLAFDQSLSDGSETRAGTLEVRGPGGSNRLAVSASSLDRGVLVGRYPRCNTGQCVVDESVSRVHLLIVRVAGRVQAMDTGSRNGTYAGGRPIPRITPIADGDVLIVGRGGTEVSWRSHT